MDVDDEPIRIGQQEGRIVGYVGDFQHHPRISWLILGYADLLQESVLHDRSSCPPAPRPAWCRAGRRRCDRDWQPVRLRTSPRGPHRWPRGCSPELTSAGCRSPPEAPPSSARAGVATVSSAWIYRGLDPRLLDRLPGVAWAGSVRPATSSPPEPASCADSAPGIPQTSSARHRHRRDLPCRSGPMVNSAWKRYLLPGYSRRRNSYSRMAAFRSLSPG